MKCPYKLCDGELDPETFQFDAKIGRRGKCTKCGRNVNITRRPSGPRLTSSQRREMIRNQAARGEGRKRQEEGGKA